MVEHSDVVLYAETTSMGQSNSLAIQANDYWRPRIQSVIDRWLQANKELPFSVIKIEKSPQPHRGLGSGTQMACAIVSLLQIAANGRSRLPQILNDPHVPITSLVRPPGISGDAYAANEFMPLLAKIGQRGNRSNIGLHGFLEGGFIVDQGMQPDTTGDHSPHRETERVAFPPWPIIVIHDKDSQGDSGQLEKEMFDRCSLAPNPNRDEMISLVKMEITPAIANQDWTRFDLAIGEYGRLAGEIFAPAQGGVYRTERIAHTIETVKQVGILGATQSSWGPTVIAIAKDVEHANGCRVQLQEKLPHREIAVVQGANHSAQAWVL